MRQRVNHRRHHAHIVGRGSLHALGSTGNATEDVAAADHEQTSMPKRTLP